AVDPTPKERANWHEMHILYDSLRSSEKNIWGETLDGKKVNIIFDEPGMAELLMRQFSGRVQEVTTDITRFAQALGVRSLSKAQSPVGQRQATDQQSRRGWRATKVTRRNLLGGLMLIYFLLVVALPLTTSREPHLANQIDGKLSTAAWGAPEGSDGDPDVLEPSDPQDEAEQSIDKDSVDAEDVAAELASTDEAAAEMLGESSVVEDDAEALPAGLAPSEGVSPSPFPEVDETVEPDSTNKSTDTEAERSEAIIEEDGTNEEEVEGREPESEDEGEPRAADGALEEENAEDGTYSPDEDDVDVDESEELKRENDAELATEKSVGSEDVDAEEVPGEAAEDEAGGSGEDETHTSEGMDGDIDEAEFPSVEESDGELPAR
ncbi:hypothetical protein FOZ63_006141, partial [Perkinsus olseni]